MRNERGAALMIAGVTAVLCAVGAYVVLLMATAQARHGKFFRQRTTARYAAEAALVQAMQKLWVSPAYCGGTENVNVPGGTEPVVVTVTNCGAAVPGKTISAKATY